MKRYFPDKFPKGSQCDKSYFFNVWNSMHPEQVSKVIEHANSQRYTVKGEEVKNNSIVLTEEWQQQLQSMPFVSKEKGRMSHLLKLKSKIGVVRKERVVYDEFDFDKRPSNFDSSSQILANSSTQPQT